MPEGVADATPEHERGESTYKIGISGGAALVPMVQFTDLGY
jgi:hypothetical protein